MPSPYGSVPRHAKPRAASPAERGAEFAEIQRQLKQEAADRRASSASGVPKPGARSAPRDRPSR
jgi:hypothetical protein